MGVVCSYQEAVMPENQARLIHVFTHKHMKLLVFTSSIMLIHYKCRRKADEDHEPKITHSQVSRSWRKS